MIDSIGQAQNDLTAKSQGNLAQAGRSDSANVSSSAIAGTSDAEKNQALNWEPCKTCAARKYKDVSTDASVSFQNPTSVAPELAAQAVSAHEQEHVRNNAIEAEREGMTARSVVQIHTAVCPECGRIYVSGGTTTTYYSSKNSMVSDSTGLLVNTTA
jgi:hypothetical protein